MHATHIEHDWTATCKLVTDLCRDLHNDDGTGRLYQRIYDVKASIHASGAHHGALAIAKEAELHSAAGSWVARGDAIRQRAIDAAAAQAAADAAARGAELLAAAAANPGPYTDNGHCPTCGAHPDDY